MPTDDPAPPPQIATTARLHAHHPGASGAMALRVVLDWARRVALSGADPALLRRVQTGRPKQPGRRGQAPQTATRAGWAPVGPALTGPTTHAV